VRTAGELVWLARKRKAAIVVDVPDNESVQELRESEISRREEGPSRPRQAEGG
jgi:hypothetical protein